MGLPDWRSGGRQSCHVVDFPPKSGKEQCGLRFLSGTGMRVYGTYSPIFSVVVRPTLRPWHPRALKCMYYYSALLTRPRKRKRVSLSPGVPASRCVDSAEERKTPLCNGAAQYSNSCWQVQESLGPATAECSKAIRKKRVHSRC